jgi:hypothetical protein
MTTKHFIQNDILLPRIKDHGVLVVYDPAQRYRQLCLEMATDKRPVIDATESSIESREQALSALQILGGPNSPLDGMLVYVPAKAPVTEEERQRDPFALYGVCGSVFPAGDGDEYESLCLKAKADYATEIRRVFRDNPNPSFEVIDAIGGGSGWPNLQASLKVESARDILFSLLAPSDQQKESLKTQDAWVAEAKDIFRSCLGMKLLTRGKTWTAITDELWRFILFSEFVFDLPEQLPQGLADVPRAELEARPLVEDVCDRLRNDRRAQGNYIDRAEHIEAELNLKQVCQQITDLGVRDTFPFEERSFFHQAVAALQRDDIDTVRGVLGRHARSVWIGKGECQAQWMLLQAAVCLIEACDDADRQLADNARSQQALIDFYLRSLREVDRMQREFEQATGDYIDTQGDLHQVVAQARSAYRSLAEKIQGLFVKHLETSGWPPTGLLANTDVFDRLVAPKLQESGRKVAYLLVDALRYELGVALEKQLLDDGQVEMQAAFAQLPTVTPVGMASLLPGAGQKLRLAKSGNEMVPMLGETALPTVTQRMGVFRERYGQRFAEVLLDDFNHAKFKLVDAVDLLVIRTTLIDSHLESSPETTLAVIAVSLKRIRVAIHKLRDLGFSEVIIATDHGFFLNAHAEAGDVCAKPFGNWVNLHERSLLGSGTSDGNNFILPTAHLGIRSDFEQIAGPRGMVSYRAGQLYFHGGASLQEAVVPVIVVKLGAEKAKEQQQFEVTIAYKRGANRITTRLPVVEVTVKGSDLFSMGAEVEILLEAHDKKAKVVGEARPGGPVNPATGTITLRSGVTQQVTLKMDLDFEGKFTVKALDPTTLASRASLDLETDYTV